MLASSQYRSSPSQQLSRFHPASLSLFLFLSHILLGTDRGRPVKFTDLLNSFQEKEIPEGIYTNLFIDTSLRSARNHQSTIENLYRRTFNYCNKLLQQLATRRYQLSIYLCMCVLICLVITKKIRNWNAMVQRYTYMPYILKTKLFFSCGSWIKKNICNRFN